MSNPFTYPARRKVFEESCEALRRLFPDARESFIRKQAQSNARNVPVERPPRKLRMKVDVAQTYCTPTRAERAEAHARKMERKAGRRNYGSLGYRVRANLSRNHPDYGCTPAEHEQRKHRRMTARAGV